MKNYTRSFLAALVLATLVISSSYTVTNVEAQADRLGATGGVLFNPRANWITRGVGTDDTNETRLLVKYIGTSASGTVTVAVSTGDITFKSGTSGSEAAETGFECPVSGGLGGIIDTSNAACDTFGKVVDIINASSSWRAVIIDGLRSTSSNADLVTKSETAANSPDGVALYSDTSQGSFRSYNALLTPAQRKMSFYLQGRGTLITNPFNNLRSVLFNQNSVSTYASGTSRIHVYCDTQTFAAAGSAVEDTFSIAAGATTVVTNTSYGFGMGCPVGARLVSAVVNSAALATVQNSIGGIQF